MRLLLPTLVVLGILVEPAATSARQAQHELLVFAAASLSDVLRDVGEKFRSRSGSRVDFNFAGSNELARQIAAGAPADLFVSANLSQLQRLESLGAVRRADRIELLGNRLVVIVPAGSGMKISSGVDLLACERLALADPAAVPAGLYARRWLEQLELWGRMADRVVPMLDVRAALAAVETGNLPAGVVYETDARGRHAVRVAFRVPEAESPQIRYFISPLVSSRHSSRQAFVEFVCTAEAGRIFRQYGFEFLPVPLAR